MKLVRSKDRVEHYKNEVKSVWDGHYNKNIWRTVHQAKNEEDNILLAKKDLDLFLFPTQEKCEKLFESIPKDHNIVPTFSKDFWQNHQDITQYLGILADCDALDYGCGSLARYTTELATLFKKVVGVDSSPQAIKYCKKYTDKIENIDIIEVNGVDLHQFDDKNFDFVFSNLVFQHVGNKEIMVDLIIEIHRILRSGGVFRASFWTEEKKDDHAHVYNGTGFKPEEYREIFEKIGFIVEGVSHDYPVLWITGIKDE